MSTISLRLPESVHKRVKALAESERISINQFIATAVSEKLSVLMTETYFSERGKRGSRRKYDQALRKVRKAPPVSGDER